MTQIDFAQGWLISCKVQVIPDNFGICATNWSLIIFMGKNVRKWGLKILGVVQIPIQVTFALKLCLDHSSFFQQRYFSAPSMSCPQDIDGYQSLIVGHVFPSHQPCFYLLKTEVTLLLCHRYKVPAQILSG